MLDPRTITLFVAIYSTLLVGALLVGSHGRRRHGLGLWIVALALQTVTTLLFGLRERLPTTLGVTLPNVLVVLSTTIYADAVLGIAGSRLARGWHAVPTALALLSWPLLGDDLRARVVTGNALLALGFVACTAVAWRRTSPYQASTRAMFVSGLLAHALAAAMRSAAAVHGGPEALEPVSSGPVHVVAMLAILTGSIAASIGALMLQRERAERELEKKGLELASFNEHLEARVASQVAEIVAHAKDAERLNVELRQKVRSRSAELTEALSRAAQGGGPASLAVGDTLAERFLLLGELGRGGMGVVFRARDTATDEVVALKVIQATSADELDALYRFLREASASAQVGHPAVVSARHVDVADGRLFMVFERVDGRGLDRVLRREGPLPAAVVALLGARIAEALAAAHAAGVVHRDLKPGNVMLSASPPSVRLLDFGISKLRETGAAMEHATQQGTVLGTPAYMAPEQVVDSSTASGASDVFSLGVMLYETLSGRLPFDERELYALLFARLVRDAAPLAELASEAPALVALIHRCLAREPGARPSAAVLATELDALAEDLGAVEADLAALALRPSLAPPDPALGVAATARAAP